MLHPLLEKWVRLKREALQMPPWSRQLHKIIDSTSPILEWKHGKRRVVFRLVRRRLHQKNSYDENNHPQIFLISSTNRGHLCCNRNNYSYRQGFANLKKQKCGSKTIPVRQGVALHFGCHPGCSQCKCDGKRSLSFLPANCALASIPTCI